MKILFKILSCVSFSIFTLSTTATPPLFDAFPKLKETLPYIALGNLETTPIIHAQALDQQGAALWVKNDGVYGTDKNGKKIFAGNKRRKLEFLLADALAHHKKHVYTYGGAGSNHATATAAYARELELACTLVLCPQRNTRYVQRNLKLDLFYGADVVAAPTRKERTLTCQRLAQQDPQGYFIPLGGSNHIGAIGYVNAAFELKNQIARGTPKPDVIYITVSSAGMAAGLIVGLTAAGLNIPVNVVRIDDSYQENMDELTRLIHETSEYLHQHDQRFPLLSINDCPMRHIDDMAGEKYVKPNVDTIACQHRGAPECFGLAQVGFDEYALTTPEGAKAIKTLVDSTNIKLDGTYSGKAFSACLRDLRTGKLRGKTVLFWDSFCQGDFSEYTSAVDTKKLPAEFQKYINEAPGYEIQRDDQGV